MSAQFCTPAERVAGGEQRRVGQLAAHVRDGGLDVLEREPAVRLRSLRARRTVLNSRESDKNININISITSRIKSHDKCL